MDKKRNVLLVYPELPVDTYWSYSTSLHYIGKKANMPPLGLITVAAMMPSNYELKLVDMNIEKLTDEQISWADIIFTSSMIIQKESHQAVIARAKKHKKMVVAGGPLPTQYFSEIKDADCIMIGEAESGILESFLHDYEMGCVKRAYARPIVRQTGLGNKIDTLFIEEMVAAFGDDIDLKIADKRPSIEESKVPRFDLLDIKKYASMAIQTSRGCPFNCEFCNQPTLFGNTPRLRGQDYVVRELEEIYNLGYRGAIFIVDDNFIGNKVRVKKTLESIIGFQKEKKYPFNLFTEADITLSLDDELMQMMRDANFNMVFVGLESPDVEVLRSMGKSQNVRLNLLESVRKIQSYGMEVTGGFIVGNDSDPDDICDKIFDFCQEAGIVTAMVGLMTAVKGSILYEKLKEQGRLIADTTGNNTHSFEMNFKTIKDPQKIAQDYKILMARLYDASGKNYYARVKTLSRNMGEGPVKMRNITWTEISCLIKSLFWQALFSRYAGEYRKTLVDYALNNRRMFSEAVAKSVYFSHYREITSTALKADSTFDHKTVYEHLANELTDFKKNLDRNFHENYAKGEEWCAKARREAEIYMARLKSKSEILPQRYRKKLYMLCRQNLACYTA